MGFNGHFVDHLGNTSSLVILHHLAGDGLVEFLDLVLTIHVLVVHYSLFMLNVKGMLADVVLVLSFLEGNLTFVTLFGF